MGKSIGYITRESALIVFSILIALGVNEWRMRVADEAEKQRALAAVYAELVDNLEIVEGLPEYHGAIAQAIASLIDEAGANPDSAARTPYEAFTGIEVLRPAIISDRLPQAVAWDLAIQRGAAARFDYETARSLSVIYDSQTKGVLPLFDEIGALLVRPEMWAGDDYAAALFPLAAQFAELASREETLVARLKRQTETMIQSNPNLKPDTDD